MKKVSPNQAVEKCFCCNVRFSDISICAINARHKKALSIALKKRLDELKLRGETSLIVRDELIVAVHYNYENQSEIDRANQIVQEINDLCLSFLNDEISNKYDVELICSASKSNMKESPMKQHLAEIQESNEVLIRECHHLQNLFIRVEITPLHAKHVDDLLSSLSSLYEEADFYGKLSLIVFDDLIMYVQYEFANESEAHNADFINDEIIDKCLEITEITIHCSEREIIRVFA